MFTITSGVSFDDERIAATSRRSLRTGWKFAGSKRIISRKYSRCSSSTAWDKLLGETEIQCVRLIESQPIRLLTSFILEKAAEALAGQAADKLRIAEEQGDRETQNQLSALTAAPERVYVTKYQQWGDERRRGESQALRGMRSSSGFVPGDR